MNNKSDKSKLYKILLLPSFLVGIAVGSLLLWLISSSTSSTSSKIDTTLLERVQKIISQKYDGDIDYSKMSEGAASGAVAALGDPYTVFLDEKSNKELESDLSGELSGIGIEVGIKNDKLTVIAPIDGTPADKAGIKAGDYIAEIDGVDSRTLTIDEAVSKIRGDKGTKVKLTIVRGSESPKELEITREIINVPSVSFELKEGNVGYIKIRRFGDDTASLVRSAGQQLISNGAKAIVVDVRDNPGGFLQSSVNVASEFMNDGVVVEERSRNFKPEVKRATPGGVMTEIPVVVIINEGSASASEILAGALRDNDRATIVGQKSFGKGSVQEVVCINTPFLTSRCKGPSLKVTIANWFTPNGTNISKEGIKPDVEIKAEENITDVSQDKQLQEAINLAKQKAQ